MDAQTEFAAEIFKTLTQEQKDAILDLVSKIAAHEKGLYIPADQSKRTESRNQPTQGGRFRYYTDLPQKLQGEKNHELVY